MKQVSIPCTIHSNKHTVTYRSDVPDVHETECTDIGGVWVGDESL